MNDKIELLAFDKSSAHIFFSLVDDNRSYLKKWLPWLDSTQCVNDSEKFIAEKISLNKNKESIDYFIAINKKIIGTVGVREIKGDSGIVGYWIDEDFQSKGIVTWALKQTIRSSKSIGIKKLYLRFAPHNIASKRVAEKCNFTYKETLKKAENLYGESNDLIVYSLNL